jgi:serine/threonine-protein kinase
MPEMPADSGTVEAFKLSGYEILGEIARGGMGVVYKARQRSLDRLVALKCLPPSFRDDPDRLACFQAEASAAAKLTKHGIVPVYDVVEAAGAPVLVMPYIDGSDLARILADRVAVVREQAPAGGKHPWAALPETQYLEHVLGLLDRVMDALMRLHHADVLHRDIKPSNILVDAHGDGWLTDFGLSRFGRHTSAWAGTVGTPGYMSPEQWDDKADVDGRADVFSLGVTAYQALTLDLPYGRKRIQPTTPAPAPASQRNSRMPERFDTVLFKAIHPDRTQRYQSAAELNGIWKRARHESSPHTPGGWWRCASRRQRAAAVTAVTLALLLVVGGTAWIASLWAGSGGRTASGRPELPRNVTVHIVTEPPGASVVFVPLHPDTGEPEREHTVRPPRGQTTPLQIELAPGPYFVEAGMPDGRFHQVYREIPLPGQRLSGGIFPHRSWIRRDDDSVELPVIKILQASTVAKMARFPGSKNFILGCDELAEAQPPHVQPVAAFFLDVHEATVGEYRATRGKLPLNLLEPPGDDFAVTSITYDEALHSAEIMGKRLPTEAEYEYAATMGGKQKFPWGDDKERIKGWPLQVVGQPDYDHAPTEPPVYGLYSNVAEWTSTWHLHYPTKLPIAFPEDYRNTRTVRGGPYTVVTGRPTKEDASWGPRYRYGVSIDRAWPGLGFRCARSVEPLFLNQ